MNTFQCLFDFAGRVFLAMGLKTWHAIDVRMRAELRKIPSQVLMCLPKYINL